MTTETRDLSEKIADAEQTMRDHFRIDGPMMRDLCKSLRPFGVDNPEDAMEIAKQNVKEMMRLLHDK